MNEKILLVEDTQTTQMVIEALLGKTYQFKKASTLVEARRRLIEMTPDLIILDAELPDGDGFSFCSLIRKDPKYNDTKILILTGRIDEEEKAFALKLGAADYVTKPFSNDDLLARVKNLLSQKAA